MNSLVVIPALLVFAAGSGFAVSDDLDSAFNNLKDAESKKDTALVKKYSQECITLAQKAVAEPAPAGATEKENWTNHITYAKDVMARAEYALSAQAAYTKPAETVDLLSTLEQLSPKSKYLGESYSRYLYALSQTGATSKIAGIAEKALANFPDNEDLLLVMADHAFAAKQAERSIRFSERLINVLSHHPAPEGVSAADWEKKRSASLGRGYWIAGIMHAEKTQYFEANRDLRAALPLIKGNDAMMAPALFYLGLANYQLGSATRNRGQVLEGATFSDQAAAMKSQYSQQAWKNAQIMRAEAAKIR